MGMPVLRTSVAHCSLLVPGINTGSLKRCAGSLAAKVVAVRSQQLSDRGQQQRSATRKPSRWCRSMYFVCSLPRLILHTHISSHLCSQFWSDPAPLPTCSIHMCPWVTPDAKVLTKLWNCCETAVPGIYRYARYHRYTCYLLPARYKSVEKLEPYEQYKKIEKTPEISVLRTKVIDSSNRGAVSSFIRAVPIAWLLWLLWFVVTGVVVVLIWTHRPYMY